MKDVTGHVVGYVHRTTGAFVSPEQMGFSVPPAAVSQGA
jgi:hypothetical protein